MAEFEKAPGETPFQYTATDNDWYGLVVFNNSPGSLSATFTVEFNQGPCEVDELVDRVCETDRGVPRTYSFQQTSNSWAGVAVSHLGGDDKDIDIYDHPEATGVPLVGSYFSQGTDFVVGDFNHAALGAYYPQVTYGGSAVDYTVEWDGDQEQLLPGIPESGSVGEGNPDCGLIRVWDCDLEAGREYAFILTTKGSADVRLALFRNPGPGVPWAGRAQAEFEKTALDPPHLYTAPDTDRYAVVVFNNSHGGDDYTLRMESDECSRLTSASCQTSNLRPGCFSFEHLPASWTAVAVKPAEGDDKDICVYDNPHALGTPLNCSSRLEGTDVLVGDFNHNPPGTYYARVVGGAEGANHVVEWSNGPELLYPATPVSGTVGGASGDCGLVRIFNLPLESGRQHCFTLLEEGAADIRLALFKNPGSGSYWAGRALAEFEKGAAETPYLYTATSDDWFGLVVFNDSPGSVSGNYTLRMDVGPCATPPSELVAGECQASTGVPKVYSLVQESSFWAAVAVNPSAEDDKDICVFDNPGGAGTPLVCSSTATGTDFVLGDFNHTPTGIYYPQVTFGDGSASYLIEWDGGPETIELGATVNGSVGGGGGDCGLIRVWDVPLASGGRYRFHLSTEGAADIRVALFKNPGSSAHWTGRNGREFELLAAGSPYQYEATGDDRYGLVVFNDSPGSPSGSFTVRVEDLTPPGCPEPCPPGPRVLAGEGVGQLGELVEIEIMLRDTPVPVDAFSLEVQYDAGMLAFAPTDEACGLTAGWGELDAADSQPPGVITIEGIDAAAIPPGSLGCIARLTFEVICPDCVEGEASPLVPRSLGGDLAGIGICCGTFMYGHGAACPADGDVDENGVLTPGDAQCAFRIFLHAQTVPSGCDVPEWDCEIAASDVNCNEVVTPGDALAIFRRFLDGLPPEHCFARDPPLMVAKSPLPAMTAPPAEHYRLDLAELTSSPPGPVAAALVMDPLMGEAAFGFELDFDPAAFEYLGLAAGRAAEDWIALDGEETAGGRLIIGGFDPRGLDEAEVRSALDADGRVTIATLSFHKRVAGVTPGPVHWRERILGGNDAGSPPGTAAVGGIFLGRPYPNPSRSGALMVLSIPGGERRSVRISVYDLLGRRIRTIVDGRLSGGIHWAEWDRRDEMGRVVGAGVYFFDVRSADFVARRKLVVLD
jgi:hypothetical protein